MSTICSAIGCLRKYKIVGTSANCSATCRRRRSPSTKRCWILSCEILGTSITCSGNKVSRILKTSNSWFPIYTRASRVCTEDETSTECSALCRCTRACGLTPARRSGRVPQALPRTERRTRCRSKKRQAEFDCYLPAENGENQGQRATDEQQTRPQEQRTDTKQATQTQTRQKIHNTTQHNTTTTYNTHTHTTSQSTQKGLMVLLVLCPVVRVVPPFWPSLFLGLAPSAFGASSPSGRQLPPRYPLRLTIPLRLTASPQNFALFPSSAPNFVRIPLSGGLLVEFVAAGSKPWPTQSARRVS